MGSNSAIEWTDHTFNPWRGCGHVSPGCEHCYAETLAKRNPKVLGVWGVKGTRVVASEAMWRQPLKWNTAAERAGVKALVFCASLADVGEDRRDLRAPRERLCDLIRATPWLRWLLLTKRIENLAHLFPQDVLERCGVGTSAEDQPRADARLGELLVTPAAFRFVSCEPLLDDVDLTAGLHGDTLAGSGRTGFRPGPRLEWVIVGGESGPGARPCDLDAIRSIVRQCDDAGVKIFVKQLGAMPHVTCPVCYGRGTGDVTSDTYCGRCSGGHRQTVFIADRKGSDMAEWPADLRGRRAFPKGARL